MNASRIIQLSPKEERWVECDQTGDFTYRWAYARSADTRAVDDDGQDYLVLRVTTTSLVFALCDGVSQSFYGNVAAGLLGEHLVAWMADMAPATLQKQLLGDSLRDALNGLTQVAGQKVQNHPLPNDTPPMFRQVLEQKRNLGSESMFICGRIDLPNATMPGGRIFCAWMGDSRLRLWQPAGQIYGPGGDEFKTTDRWSTRRGLVGPSLHVWVEELAADPTAPYLQLLAYSDGLPALDDYDEPARLSNDSINALIAQAGAAPTSDDISLLEVWVGAQPPWYTVDSAVSLTSDPVGARLADGVTPVAVSSAVPPLPSSVDNPVAIAATHDHSARRHDEQPTARKIALPTFAPIRQVSPTRSAAPLRRLSTPYLFIGIGLAVLVLLLGSRLIMSGLLLPPTVSLTPTTNVQSNSTTVASGTQAATAPATHPSSPQSKDPIETRLVTPVTNTPDPTNPSTAPPTVSGQIPTANPINLQQWGEIESNPQALTLITTTAQLATTLLDIGFSTGDTALTIASDKTVRLYTISKNTYQDTSLPDFPDGVSKLALNPVHKRVAVASASGNVFLSTVGELDPYKIGEMSSAVADLVFSDDGNKLASFSSKSITLWNFASGITPTTYTASDVVTSLAFDASDSLLLAGLRSGEIYSWNLSTKGKPMRLHSAVDSTAITTLAVSIPIGSHYPLLAAGCGDGSFYIWVPTKGGAGSALHTDPANQKTITNVAFNANGTLFAKIDTLDQVNLWQVGGYKQVWTAPAFPSPPRRLAFSADKRLLAIGLQDGRVQLWGVPASPAK